MYLHCIEMSSEAGKKGRRRPLTSQARCETRNEPSSTGDTNSPPACGESTARRRRSNLISPREWRSRVGGRTHQRCSSGVTVTIHPPLRISYPLLDRLLYPVRVEGDFLVPESQHTKSTSPQAFITTLVVLGLLVMAPIHFDDEASGQTDEVDDVVTDWMLAPEPDSQIPPANHHPDTRFRWCQVAAHRASTFNRLSRRCCHAGTVHRVALVWKGVDTSQAPLLRPPPYLPPRSSAAGTFPRTAGDRQRRTVFATSVPHAVGEGPPPEASPSERREGVGGIARQQAPARQQFEQDRRTATNQATIPQITATSPAKKTTRAITEVRQLSSTRTCAGPIFFTWFSLRRNQCPFHTVRAPW